MVMGAMGGALMMRYLPDGTSAFVVVAATILGSAADSVCCGLPCLSCSDPLKTDQTLVGTAMNILGTAAATVIVKSINTITIRTTIPRSCSTLRRRKRIVSNIGGFEFNWLMLLAVFVLVVSFVVLYKTKFGLRLMACGEHPQQRDPVGINVYKMRWAGVLISGALGGLGGSCTSPQVCPKWKFEYGVAGFGFLSLAVMIFGKWKPQNIALAALLFGFFRALSNVYAGFDFLVELNIPGGLYNIAALYRVSGCAGIYVQALECTEGRG